MAGDLQCTLIQRSTCIVLMCYLVTPGFKAAWRSCTNETAVRHLDVDAPLVMDGLAAQEASGMWSRKTVQCSTGAPALLRQRHALSRTCGIILLQEGSPARVFIVSATAESNHQQRRRITVALRCISAFLTFCPVRRAIQNRRLLLVAGLAAYIARSCQNLRVASWRASARSAGLLNLNLGRGTKRC